MNPDIVVSAGERLNLRCFQNDFNDFVETAWYRNDEALRRTTTRIRVTKQSLKFKYVESGDAGVYACRVESDETVEWRNVTVRVEPVQNDGFEGEGEETSGGVIDALRPEEETNDLETENRSE